MIKMIWKYLPLLNIEFPDDWNIFCWRRNLKLLAEFINLVFIIVRLYNEWCLLTRDFSVTHSTYAWRLWGNWFESRLNHFKVKEVKSCTFCCYDRCATLLAWVGGMPRPSFNRWRFSKVAVVPPPFLHSSLINIIKTTAILNLTAVTHF